MAVHERSIEVDAPIHEVFLMWRNWDNFPAFMSHVKEVKELGGGKSHWRANIAGLDEEWDAETTRVETDRAIGWRSITGLDNSGEVRFDQADGNRTRVTVHIEYNPPASVLGDAAEAVYVGREFDQDLQEDLDRFKERVEA